MSRASTLSPALPRISSSWTADLSLLLVAVVWGSSYLAAKTVLASAPVYLFLFARFGLTVVLMLPFVWKHLRNSTREEWFVGGILGLFLLAIFSLETRGVSLTTATNAGLIISLAVVLVPLVEGAAFRRFPGWGLLGAVGLSFAGTALLTVREGWNLQFNAGDVLIFGAALVRAFNMTYTQKLTAGKELNSLALTVIQFIVVTVGTGVVSVATLDSSALRFPVDAQFWVLTLYLTLSCTLFAFYIQLTMIRRTSPSRVGLLMGTEPIFAALFAMQLGGEQLSWQGWLGGAILVGATFWGRKAEERRRVLTQAQTAPA
ncbi:DMT family transporter [Stigmatella hybrida]|uniref:DMT family transporter n=1 Tax=Stigmatella hybrida TaxID=394097 RepID=UPI001CDB1820|nr:DMT family transporter [Stigmatella hybrida]